jgi:hypothetical protein
MHDLWIRQSAMIAALTSWCVTVRLWHSNGAGRRSTTRLPVIASVATQHGLVLPAASKSALVALHDRMNRLEQLCYAQVRRINALEAELDYLRARRQEGSR